MEPLIKHDSCITTLDKDGSRVDVYLLPKGGKLDEDSQRPEILKSSGCQVLTRPVRKSRRNQGYHLREFVNLRI
eukprot:12324707-Karenia_brevis.AAC.1